MRPPGQLDRRTCESELVRAGYADEGARVRVADMASSAQPGVAWLACCGEPRPSHLGQLERGVGLDLLLNS